MCLSCGAKFRYEASVETLLVAKEVTEHVVRHTTETFDCASCSGHFSINSRGRYECPTCKKTVCASCLYEPKLHGPGKKCKECKGLAKQVGEIIKGLIVLAAIVAMSQWVCR
jgi:hypothetical protein